MSSADVQRMPTDGSAAAASTGANGELPAAAADAVADAAADDAAAQQASSAGRSSSPPAPPACSLSIRFGDVTKDNWQQLRRLNLAVFPVLYSDKFYADSHSAAVRAITRLALHNDVLIAAVCARYEQPTVTQETILNRVSQRCSSQQSALSCPPAPPPLTAVRLSAPAAAAARATICAASTS